MVSIGYVCMPDMERQLSEMASKHADFEAISLYKKAKNIDALL
jgi:hypothetical protein